MAIPVVCTCGKKLNLKDEFAGKAVRCPSCQGTIRVPGVKAPPSAPSRPKPAAGAPKPAQPVRKPAAAARTATGIRKPAGAVKRPTAAKPSLSDDLDLLGPEPSPSPHQDPGIDLMGAPSGSDNGGAPADKECPNCGQPVPAGDPFCLECGTDLKTGKRMEPPKPPGFMELHGKRLIFLGVILIAGIGGYVGWIQPWLNATPVVKAEAPDKFLQTLLKEGKPDATNELFDRLAACLRAAGRKDKGEDKEKGEKPVRHPVDVIYDVINLNSRDDSPLLAARALYILSIAGFSTDNSPTAIELLLRSRDPEVRSCALRSLFALGYEKMHLQNLPFMKDHEGDLEGIEKKPFTNHAVVRSILSSVTSDDQSGPEALFLLALGGDRDRLDSLFQKYGTGDDVAGRQITALFGLKFDDRAQAAPWWAENKTKLVVDCVLERLDGADEETKKGMLSRLAMLHEPSFENAAQWKEWWAANKEKFTP